MPDDEHPFDAAMREHTEREWADLKSKRTPLTPEQQASLKAVVHEEFEQRQKAGASPGWRVVLRLLRSPLGYAGLAAAVILFGVLLFRPAGLPIEMAALPGPDRGSASLPRRLLLDSKLTRLELVEGEVRLSGQMKALPGLARPGVLVFTNNLSGTDSSGVLVWVRCLAWVTNASGATSLKSTNDVKGVLLQGTLEIPGRSTNDVEHGYAP